MGLPFTDDAFTPPDDAKPADVTGQVTVLVSDDFEHGKSSKRYLLEDKAHGRTFDVRFAGRAPRGLQSGATVRVHGRAKGAVLYLEANGTTNTSVETLAPGASLVAGDQKTLVVALSFADAALSCSVSDIQDLMFSDPAGQSVDQYYQATSFGHLSVSGIVAGTYTINASSTDICNPGAWADEADAAAAADGIDLSAYPRKVYVLPKANSCGYAGLGQVGGTPSRAWTFRCNVSDSYAHELGHNFGMGHASTPTNEYGDTSDVMGYAGWGLRDINSPHSEQMGWTPPVQIVPVTQSGTFDIAPLEIDPTQASLPQAIKIAKPDTGEYYYLSYRLPTGFDINLAFTYQRRLTVHRYLGDGTAARTYLLGTLADGGIFTDDVNGISVTQLNHDDDHVSVQVQMGPTTCQTGAPSLAVTPSSQSGAPGATKSYAVSITNMDWSSCPESSFDLAAAMPGGWSGGISPSTLVLLPGEVGSATFTVSSTSTATDGVYGLSVSASDPGVAGHDNTTGATYVVGTPCSRNAPSVSVSPSSQTGAPGATLSYSVTVTNADGESCPSSTYSLSGSRPSGWAGSLSTGTLNLTPGQSGHAAYAVTSPTGATGGAYSLAVNVTDTAVSGHNASRGAIYTVYVPSDTQAPTAPNPLTATLKRSQVKLAWGASSDTVGVTGYDIWRNGVLLASTTGTSYTDNVQVAGSYSYYVLARDAAGNLSAPSNTVGMTVGGGGGGKGGGKKN